MHREKVGFSDCALKISCAECPHHLSVTSTNQFPVEVRHCNGSFVVLCNGDDSVPLFSGDMMHFKGTVECGGFSILFHHAPLLGDSLDPVPFDGARHRHALVVLESVSSLLSLASCLR